MTTSNAKSLNYQPGTKPGGNVRWLICAVLFGAIVVIYVHRNVVSVLKDAVFARQYGWSTIDYGHISACFTLSYAVGMFFAGRILDRVGVRKGFLIAAIVWTIIAASHGLLSHVSMDSPMARNAWVIKVGGMSVVVFGLMRFGLGIFEGAFFPASIRAVAEWFPKQERALATGIFNAGSAFGAILSPLAVPWIADHWGWPSAFYLAAGLGAIWVGIWFLFYREPQHHPMLSESELNYICADREPPTRSLPWAAVLGHRQTVAFCLGKFMTDPVWWFYIFWLPGALASQFKLDLKHFGPPLLVVYLMADGGSVLGGWLSSIFLNRGWSVNRARKTAMGICAVCVLPMFAVSHLTNVWPAVFIIGLAAAAHQGWSANLFTIPADTSPRSAVGSIVGIGGMCGALGSFILQNGIGYILHWTHDSYQIPFAIAGSAYIAALIVIHLLLPRLEPMVLNQGPAFEVVHDAPKP